ncbi:MAG: virulence RhuM family protein, partial [Deltaproteobacteria bacterium]|nr:virulence RhuM family protein [Deltaproteobacteria bacterium]
GYVLDKERLKNGAFLGKDYFDNLLEEVREIRASERRFYQKITDIYSTAVDYDPEASLTQNFFASVQNKMHFAIHGHTAAEIIKQRADSKKPHMGLMTWKRAPKGKVLKSDVSVAKNYLLKDEIEALDRVVSMYLDYAEDQAKRKIPMTMEDWTKKLDAFLKFNERDILDNLGKVSAEVAKTFAENEFEKYRLIQDKSFESDFDREVVKLLKAEKKK